MKITKVLDTDIVDVFKLGKELLNFYNLMTARNDDFVDRISNYVISTIVEEATSGYFIETDDGKRIGVIIYSVPGDRKLFSIDQINIEYQAVFLKRYVETSNLTNNEKMIVIKEMDIVNGFNFLAEKYEILTQNRAEIKLLYIEPEYRGRYLSKPLFSFFLEDIRGKGFTNFFLFTTTEYNFHFYDKIKMRNLETIIYTKVNCPEFLKYKITLPLKCMIYFGSIKEINL